MKLKILAFGITKDILGTPELILEVEEPVTVQGLKEELGHRYPDFKTLASLAVAVNSEYAEAEQVLDTQDEIALIPPVSGG